MVKFSTIEQSNAAFAKQHVEPLVVVLAGATSNLGAGTLEHLAKMLHNSTFYVLGRSAARFAAQRQTLQRLSPSLKVVYIEIDVSLIAGVDEACEQIASAEGRVDYLFMSQGCIPLTVPQCMRTTPPRPAWYWLADMLHTQTPKKASTLALPFLTSPGSVSSTISCRCFATHPDPEFLVCSRVVERRPSRKTTWASRIPAIMPHAQR